MNYGFIYCLSNEAMPGIYKIGQTSRTPSARCDELSKSTSAAKPFEVLIFAEVENPLETERLVHEHFAAFRVNQDREFFRIPLTMVESLFHGVSSMVCVSNQAQYLILREEGMAA